MSKIENAVRFMIDTANDNTHGYAQDNRTGTPDYDCSSLVITAFAKAGFPVKKYGATYTGNMKRAFIKAGFKDVIKKINLITGIGLLRGDILLNETCHTAVYIGNGLIAQASINEKGSVTGGKPGDQTGREINISKYHNYIYGWNAVLRYTQKEKRDDKLVEKRNDKLVEKRIFIVKGKEEQLDTIFKDNQQYVKLQELQRVGLLKAVWDPNTKKTALINI